MTHPLQNTANAAPMVGWFATLAESMRALHALARKLDAWLAQRRRAASDQAALASMSDRDLLDIGVSRASIEAAAHGTWRRDDPR